MASHKFEKGNQFWNNRSKHGRDLLFGSPQLMWEAACEYFNWADENPFKETKAMTVSNGAGEGSSIELVELPVKRPYTLIELCLYLDCSSSYFRHFKSTATESKSDFVTVIAKIEEIVYNQKFSGAASGFFNANIIARDLGLKEHTDHTTGGEKLPSNNTIITGLSDETLKEIASKLPTNKSSTPGADA